MEEKIRLYTVRSLEHKEILPLPPKNVQNLDKQGLWCICVSR